MTRVSIKDRRLSDTSSIDHLITPIEVAIRSGLMQRAKSDGVNEKEIEAEPKGEGELPVSGAVVVSCMIYRISQRLKSQKILSILNRRSRKPSESGKKLQDSDS